MNDLDILRPEVREAINRQDRQEKCDEYCPVCEDRATIRAELLRLATIEADALIALDCEHDWQVEHKRAEKAEAELLRLTGENARLNKIESLATEQRLQMEDAELYLMDVSQPDDEDAHWCDRMKSAIELLVQDCNYAVGQKNKAEAELAALKAKIEVSPLTTFRRAMLGTPHACVEEKFACPEWIGKRVRLVVEE